MKRQRDYSDDYHSMLCKFPREEVDAALNYAKKLKTWFHYDQPEEKIHSLGRILEKVMDTRAAHDGAVGRLTVVPKYFSARVKAIVGGNHDLIGGLNSFLPPLYQISLDDEEKETEAAMESKTIGDREPMEFVKKLDSKCGKDGCEALLKNFRSCKEGSRSLADVCGFGHRVTEGHPDLHLDFSNFMPITEATPLAYCLPDLQSSEFCNCRVDELQKKSPQSFDVCEKNKESEFVKADGSQVKGSSLDNEEKNKTEATTESKAVRYRDGMDFINNLKIKCGEDGCEKFLTNFNLLKKGLRTSVDFFDSGLKLIEGHADLQKDFTKFMPLSDLEKPLVYHLSDFLTTDLTNTRAAEEPQKKSQNDKEAKFVKADGAEVKGSDSTAEKLREGIGFFEKVKKRLPCEVNYKKFLKLFFYYIRGKIGKAELLKMVANLIGNYPDLMSEFDNFWRNCDSLNVLEVRGCKTRDKWREEHKNKSMEELDLYSCKRCTTRRRHPNHYEKNMFECEDELYELDMLVEWFKSAVIYAEQLGVGTVKNEEKNGSGRIFLRCIERLYGDQGVEVLDIFHKDHQRALPVLKMRLQQKLTELIQYRQSLKKYWG